MGEKFDSASSSGISSLSSEDDWNDLVDARQIYHGTIADITFRPVGDGSAVTINRNVPVIDILQDGPNVIMGHQQQSIRWIHLPSNNMAWVEDTIQRLEREQTETSAQSDDTDVPTGRLGGVLRKDVWRNVFHGRHSNAVHSRFLMPLASRYASAMANDPDSDETAEKWQDGNVLALYLPYFHWESYNSWKHRQRHISKMKLKRHIQGLCDCNFETVFEPRNDRKLKETVLLHQDLFNSRPLHDRRSLDQSYFYNLRNVAYKDEDQVVGLHTWERGDPRMTNRKMMMVDQLWLWIIDNKTIITAFPDNYESTETETDISQLLFKNLTEVVQQGTVKSINGMISHIVDICTGVFHRSDISPEVAFFEFFADEIGKSGTEVEEMLRYFRQVSALIESHWTNDSITRYQMSRHLDELFSIKEEIRVMARVDKIVSDLIKIDFVCSQQEEVLRDLLKCSRTSSSLTGICDTVARRRAAWSGMAVTAKAIKESLLGLLDLKQRQASVSEARTIRVQIEISAKQGKSIMLLTVFTVLFLPISVMAAIFGMNARELVGPGGGKIPFRTITLIAIPITLTLMLFALGFAFTDESRKTGNTVLAVVRQRLVNEAKDVSEAEKAGEN